MINDIFYVINRCMFSVTVLWSSLCVDSRGILIDRLVLSRVEVMNYRTRVDNFFNAGKSACRLIAQQVPINWSFLTP